VKSNEEVEEGCDYSNWEGVKAAEV